MHFQKTLTSSSFNEIQDVNFYPPFLGLTRKSFYTLILNLFFILKNKFDSLFLIKHCFDFCIL